MTREDLKKLFPDATDDQITKMLNMHNSEINIERNKAALLKDKADQTDDLQNQIAALQQQLDDVKGSDSTELQKALDKKETAAATAKEQEIAQKAGNPGGGQGSGGDSDTHSNAEKLADLVKSTNSFDTNIVSQYI